MLNRELPGVYYKKVRVLKALRVSVGVPFLVSEILVLGLEF